MRGDGGGDPVDEGAEVIFVIIIKTQGVVADSAQGAEVGEGADADGDKGGALLVVPLPAGDGGSGVVGRLAVGHEVDHGLVVAFLCGAVGDDVVFDFGHDVFEYGAEGGTGADGQAWRVEGEEFSERCNGARHTGKGDNAEVHGFKRIRVGTQGFDEAVDAFLHLAQVVAGHAFGDVDNEVNGEAAHGGSLGLAEGCCGAVEECGTTEQGHDDEVGGEHGVVRMGAGERQP